MQHSYDLVFQSNQVGEAIALQPLLDALKTRGGTFDADGRGTWKLEKGDVTVSPIVEVKEGSTGGEPGNPAEKKVVGLDVRVPLRDTTALLEQVLGAMCEVAEASGVRVMDPQRGDTASITSLSSVTDEYLRVARYAGEYGAVSEALGLSTYAAPTTEPESSPFRPLMILAVLVVAAYIGYRVVTLRKAAPPPGPMDGPSKVLGK